MEANSDINTDEKWKLFGSQTRDGFLYSEITKKKRKLTNEEKFLLPFLLDFDTIQNHSERVVRAKTISVFDSMLSTYSRIPFIGGKISEQTQKIAQKKSILERKTSQEDIVKYQNIILSLIEDDFLISENALQKRLEQALQRGSVQTDTKDLIKHVGVPTCGRPPELKRCVDSILKNIQIHSKTPRITICDDSRNEDDIQKNKEVLKTLSQKYNYPIFYVGEKERLEFAQALSRETGISEDITIFCILGDRSENTVGATRNTLLLLFGRNKSLMFDDDTICTLAQSPEYEDGIALTSQFPYKRHFHSSYKEIQENYEFQDLDILSLHEEKLGSYYSNLHKESISKWDITNLNYESSKTLLDPDNKVGTTFVGSVGDTGSISTLFYLSAERETLLKLTEKKESYTVWMKSKLASKFVSRYTITDSTFCMTMNIGIDGTGYIPPFMPVLRGEDYVFRTVQYIVQPHIVQEYMPYMIFHKPATYRRPVQDPALLFGKSNDVFASILMHSSPDNLTQSTTEREASFLKNIDEFIHMDKDTFKKEVSMIYKQRLRSVRGNVATRLFQNNDLPIWYKEDAEEMLSGIDVLLTQDTPDGLLNDIKHAEPFEFFQECISLYKELFVNWHTLRDATEKLLQERGVGTLIV